MSDLIQAQENVLAKPLSMEWGVNEKGNDQCVVSFEILEGPDAGRRISAWLYFTVEKNSERSLESLRYCGCSFPDNDVTSTEGFGATDVRLTIEHDTYNGETKARVKWINSSAPFAGKPMDDGKKSAFRDRLRGYVAKIKERTPNAGGDLPF